MHANSYYPLPCLLHVEAVSKPLVSSSERMAHWLFSHDCLVMQCSFILPLLCWDVQSLSCTLKLACFWFGLFCCCLFFLWDSGWGWRRWCGEWWVGLFVMFVSCLGKPRLLNGFVRSLRVAFFSLSCSYSLCFPGLHGDPCYPDCQAPFYEVSEQYCNTSSHVKWGCI